MVKIFSASFPRIPHLIYTGIKNMRHVLETCRDISALLKTSGWYAILQT